MAAVAILAVVTVTGCTRNAQPEARSDAPGLGVTIPPSAATSGTVGPAASGKPKALTPIPGIQFSTATSVLTKRWNAAAKDTTVGAPQVHLTAPYPGDGKATLNIWVGKGDGVVPGIACHRLQNGGSPAGKKTAGELADYCLRGVAGPAMLDDITAWVSKAEPRPEKGRQWKVARHQFTGYTVAVVESSDDVGLFLAGGTNFGA